MPLQGADTTRVQIHAISWNLFHGRDAPPDRSLYTWRSRLLKITERGPEYAQDYISRGWDYLTYKRHLHFEAEGKNAMDIDLRYFLSYGLLQKGSDEYFPWEAPRPIMHIRQVDGIRMKVTRDVDWSWFKGVTLFYTTGYRDVARWNTFRMELGFTPLSNLMGLPIILWGQSGYNSSVTQYYRKAWSVGLAASFETYQ